VGDQPIDPRPTAASGIGSAAGQVPAARVDGPVAELARPSSRRFRADIEGMRALAILVIVAYHAGVPGFSGGFVGVDVFFVISGYLITGILVDGPGAALGPVEFWARRIRRLVPGLALMVVATLVASSLIVAPFDMLEIGREGAAAAV
jgi:peptidoglycan/LPS O-acetylase OafA/YrhL